MQAQANFANEASIDGEMQAPLTFEFLDSETAQIPRHDYSLSFHYIPACRPHHSL